MADVYNLIRGTNPQPGAWTLLGGAEVTVYDSKKTDGEGEAGTVIAVGDDGVTVQAGGGRLLIQRVRPKGQDKQTAAEWGKAAGLKPGTRLG